MRKFLAWIIYLPLQLLFLPLAIFGVLLVVYKQLFVSRRLGVSQTAVLVLNSRWAMDWFGIRKDSASVKLNRELPNSSMFGMKLILFPFYVFHRISGDYLMFPAVSARGEEHPANLGVSRTMYIDEIVEQTIDDVDEFVLLGAGYDTRCLRNMDTNGVALFELDQAAVQRSKRAALDKADIDTTHVHFVEVDFAAEKWSEKLMATGYDPNKKSLFVWEGVSLYLSEADVRNTIREIKANTAEGSVLIADFYAKRFVSGELMKGGKSSTKALELTEESFRFALDFTEDYEAVLKQFLESEDVQVGKTQFMGQNSKRGCYMVVAEIKL